ncbi:hypothetical protein U8V72_21315 [Priestia filamentosa]|uniref:hypothetical protein n=1 Tax=Priestia filamentosa TaxID=1402861 RepID=UPI000588EFCF
MNKNEWIQWDDNKWYKRESENEFTFLEVSSYLDWNEEDDEELELYEIHLDLTEYSDEEQDRFARGSYKSLTHLKQTQPKEWKRFVAELAAIDEMLNGNPYLTFKTKDELLNYLSSTYSISVQEDI